MINTVFPEWRAALTTAFTGYQFGVPTVFVEDARVSTRPDLGASIWQVYPKFMYQGEVTAASQDDAKSRQAAFIDDLRDRTRTLIDSLTGTTVLEVHKQNVDGYMVVTTF